MSKYDLSKMQVSLDKIGPAWWKYATHLFSEAIGAMPELSLNSRLTGTAGRAFLQGGKVELSCYFLEQYPDAMLSNTLPHELAHIIAYRMYGEENHGKAWKMVARSLYGQCNTYHNYTTMRQAKKRQ